MNNAPEVKVELRLNNLVFRCVLENKFYNSQQVEAYAVSGIDGIMPNQGGTLAVSLSPVIICKNCYEDKKWDFKEPSKIVLPETKLPDLKSMAN